MRRLNILLVSLGILTTTTCLLGLWSFHRVSYDLDLDYASDVREDYLVEYEDDYDVKAGEDHGQGDMGKKWTKVLGGTEGFYVFENVWIRDRVVYMIPNPTSPTPLPRLEYTITSRNPDLRDHTIIAETAHQALHSKRDGYPEYPEIPRLVVLSREEAGEMGVPGFKVKVGGEVGEGSDLRVEGVGVGAEDETEAESEVEVGNAAEIEIGKELAILQVEEEDDVTRSRSRDAKFKLRSEEWQVKTRRRRWWWDSTWVDGWTGKSTASSSSSSSEQAVEEQVEEEEGSVLPKVHVEDNDNGGLQWEEEGVTVLPGTTLYFADDPQITGWGSLMHHYYHFAAELMFGAWRAYAKVELEQRTGTSSASHDNELVGKRYLNVLNHTHPEGTGPATKYVFSQAERRLFDENRLDMPRTVVFPFNNDWEGKELQEVMLEGMFGDPNLIRRDAWTRLSRKRQWTRLERVVIVDRHAAHRNPAGGPEAWGKMALDVLSLKMPESYPYNPWLFPQESLSRHLRSDPVPLRRPKTARGHNGALSGEVVKVTYVDRQGDRKRKLDEESDVGLRRVLKEVSEAEIVAEDGRTARVEVDMVRFEGLSAKEQMQVAHESDIFIGIHGNGLTHMLWTRPGATVIEFWPLHSFIRDYEIVTEAMDHDYVPVWKDRVIPKSEWLGKAHDQQGEKLQNGTLVEVDERFIRKLLNERIRRMV